MDEEVLKRAKKRTLYLLERMDRTEQQLRQKLQQNGYSEEVIEAAVSYAASFGYVNDAAYAERYVSARKGRKSCLEMKMSLLQKGVERELVEQAIDEYCEEQDELQAIQSILEKKHYSPDEATPEQKKRLQEHLARKGFHYEDIHRAMQVFSSNT
ncbi:MAG: regulatory protein RecX [Faecalimonas sp.]|nr:regulatory protein RecX [Faecalimonas sp.]